MYKLSNCGSIKEFPLKTPLNYFIQRKINFFFFKIFVITEIGPHIFEERLHDYCQHSPSVIASRITHAEEAFASSQGVYNRRHSSSAYHRLKKTGGGGE